MQDQVIIVTSGCAGRWYQAAGTRLKASPLTISERRYLLDAAGDGPAVDMSLRSEDVAAAGTTAVTRIGLTVALRGPIGFALPVAGMLTAAAAG